ncbi:MAG TPA: restriction endonuclease subunit S [Porphyromonadaceae bacterium]|nr:restriction endonuclease subunit S [Porphyromonadaceae bacterium]
MSCKEWKDLTLGELCEIVIDYRGKTPLKLGSNWSTEGYRALSAKNIKTGKIVQEESIRFVDEVLYKKWMKDEISRGDIIITSEAPFGEVLYWDSDEKIVLSQRLFGLKIKREYLSKYIYYYMTSFLFQEQLKGRATGTTVVGLRQPELLKCRISVPSIKEQKRIAAILGALDDKIELNNKINKNLEEQASALFKHWFVDFEFPDANGKPYKSSGGAFKDSELGPIPSEWKVGVLENIGDIIGGGTPSKANNDYYTANGIPWITPKDVSLKKVKFISNGQTDITDLGYKSSSTKILPKGTVLFSSRAPIGYISIANNDLCTNQGFKSVVPMRGIGTAFIYLYLKRNVDVIESKASGSTFKEASGALMKSLDVIIPNQKILDQFNGICNELFQQQKTVEAETQTLEHLRHTLLPQLMCNNIKLNT